jgi:Tfp pilus assembly PilM family ATPase
MSRTKAGLGIELAGDECRLALVESGADGFTVRSLQTVPASGDLARVIRALPMRPAGVVCSVSLASAAVRILDLPPTTDDNLERVVALEAEAVLPLPTEELALSHHMLGMTEQSRVEVLLGACVLPVVQAALARVNCLPWVSASVTVGAVALMNATQQLRGAAREPVCAILKVEADASELIVLDRSRIVTARPLPIGCAHVGSAVSSPAPVPAGVGRGSWEERSEAPAAPAAARGWVQEISQQVRYALQALSFERGVQIQRLYVCGAGGAQAGVDWELSGLLDLPVALLSPEGGAEPEGALYAAAYGCALQAVGAAAVPLNLTPARLSTAREEEQRRQSTLSWVALAAAVVIALGLVFGAALYRKSQAVEELRRQAAELNLALPVPAMPAEELKELSDAVQAAAASRVPPAQLLTILSRVMPVGTWLADVTYNADNSYVVRGFSTSANGGQITQNQLLRQQLFDEVLLDSVTEETMGDVPVWGFQVTCRAKPAEKPKRTRRSKRAEPAV